MKKPDPVINIEVLRRPEILRDIRSWFLWNNLSRTHICPFIGDCSATCQQLFGDDRFRGIIGYPCPCKYYGQRKTYLAVKKAVGEIEKEGL